ncbi:MAG: VCBS repeat-containing protein, partial [Thermoanaerobaculia bacterium]
MVRRFTVCLLLATAPPIVPPAGAQWHFTDVTISAGLDYEHGLGGPAGEPLLVSGGVAAGDFNRDGWPDLYVVRGAEGPNLLFENQAGAGFEELGESAGVAIDGEYGCGPTFADVDGDGWLDLMLGGVAGTTPRLFKNLGPQPSDGKVKFSEITAASGIFSLLGTLSAAFGDFDRDGDLDLFLTHWSLGGGDPIGAPHLWRNDGSGAFGPVDFAAGIAAVYQNVDWSFTPTFTDIDDDGWPDLLVSGDFGTSQVFRNRGDGTFAVATTGVISDENGMGSAVGDVDNDGDLDWFVSSIWDPDGIADGNWGITGNRLYRNNGDWSGSNFGFEDATDGAGVRQGYWGWGSCFADFDNDGWLD